MWRIAIDRWRYGDGEAVVEMLRDDRPVPAFAREWLAGLVDGSVKRPRGRPVNPYTLEYRHKRLVDICVATWFKLAREEIEEQSMGQPNNGERGRMSATEAALDKTAEKFEMTVDQVSRIVFPRRRGSQDKEPEATQE